YGKALQKGLASLNELPVSRRLISILHAQLLQGVRGEDRSPGELRKRQVHIGSERRFIPPPAQVAEQCLNDLEVYINTPSEIDALIRAFMVHYQFETIHPFMDGNGRVGRLLLSIMIYTWCGLGAPWLYMSSFFDRYKDEYINKLFNVSAEGAWEPWIGFCLQGVQVQAKDAIRRLDKLVALKKRYWEQVSGMSAAGRLQQIVESMFDRPVLTVPEVVRMFNVSYPTAKGDIEKLLRARILVEPLRQSHPA